MTVCWTCTNHSRRRLQLLSFSTKLGWFSSSTSLALLGESPQSRWQMMVLVLVRDLPLEPFQPRVHIRKNTVKVLLLLTLLNQVKGKMRQPRSCGIHIDYQLEAGGLEKGQFVDIYIPVRCKLLIAGSSYLINLFINKFSDFVCNRAQMVNCIYQSLYRIIVLCLHDSAYTRISFTNK